MTGAPEDQLRNPLETLFKELAEIAGYPPATVSLVPGQPVISEADSEPSPTVLIIATHNMGVF